MYLDLRPPREPRERPARIPRRPVTDAQHRALHRVVARSALGAGAATGLLHGLTGWFGHSDLASAWLPLWVAAGALAAVGVPGLGTAKKRHGLGALLGALGGGLMAGWPGFGGLFGPLALGAAAVPALAPERSWGRRTLHAALIGVLGTAGLFVAQVFLAWDALGLFLPGPLAAAGAGSAAGMFLGLGSTVRHLHPEEDPVEARFRALLEVRDGEISELLKRAFRHHRKIREQAPDLFGIGRELEPVMLKLAQAAEGVRRLDRDLADLTPRELRRRLDAMQSRLHQTEDPVARQILEEALTSLQHQEQVLQRIRQGRERVLARLHADVTLLERLRFSLVQWKATNEEQQELHQGEAVAQLDHLHRALEATSLALTEVCEPMTSLPESASY